MDHKVYDAQVAQIKLIWARFILVVQQSSPNRLLPQPIQLAHQFGWVVLVLYHQAEDALNDVLTPHEPVHYQLILCCFTEQLPPSRLFDHILAHREAFGHHHVSVFQERQSFEQPLAGVLLLVLFPRVGVEEDVLVRLAHILTEHPAHVNITAVGVRPDQHDWLFDIHFL